MSNPCRVGYFTQEICVFRDDVGGRLRRNAIRLKEKPDEDEDEMDVDDPEAIKRKEASDTLTNAKKVPPPHCLLTVY